MVARLHPFLPLACPVQNLPCGHRAGDTITLNKVTAHLPQRPGVFRGRMVNKTSGEPSEQLHERHDASDFDTKTQDKIGEKA